MVRTSLCRRLAAAPLGLLVIAVPAAAQRLNTAPGLRIAADTAPLRNGGPVREGGLFVYSDGTSVRATDPQGHDGHVNPGGSISYPDGTTVSHDAKTGVTIVDHPDGTRSITNPNGPDLVNGRYQWADGFRAQGTDPQGHPGHINPDGSVSFADGTRISHDPFSGDTKVVHPDGTVELTRPGDRELPTTSGAQGVDSGGILRWGDGFGVPARDPNGGAAHEIGGGWIGFSDGTMVSHDVNSGDTKIVRPDGTVVFNNDRTGQHSETPPWENGISTPGGAPAGSTGNQNGPGTANNGTKPDKPAPGNSNADTHQNTSSGNNNNNGSSGSGSASGNTNTDKPSKEKPDKPDDGKGAGKGMIVNGDGPGSNGTNGGGGPLVRRWNGGPFATNPTPNDAPNRPNGQNSNGATPTMVRPGSFGPGGRPNQDGGAPGVASRSRIRIGSLVVDPDPNAMRSGGVRHIDPWGGRR